MYFLGPKLDRILYFGVIFKKRVIIVLCFCYVSDLLISTLSFSSPAKAMLRWLVRWVILLKENCASAWVNLSVWDFLNCLCVFLFLPPSPVYPLSILNGIIPDNKYQCSVINNLCIDSQVLHTSSHIFLELEIIEKIVWENLGFVTVCNCLYFINFLFGIYI